MLPAAVVSRPSPAGPRSSRDPSIVNEASRRSTSARETVTLACVAWKVPPDTFITPGRLACSRATASNEPLLLNAQPFGTSSGPRRDKVPTSSLPPRASIARRPAGSPRQRSARRLACATSSENVPELISISGEPA